LQRRREAFRRVVHTLKAGARSQLAVDDFRLKFETVEKYVLSERACPKRIGVSMDREEQNGRFANRPYSRKWLSIEGFCRGCSRAAPD